MDVVWASAAGAISDALGAAGIDGSEVSAVGIGAHGDGLYLVDAELRPVRAAILATDTRAASYCERWNTGEVADALLAITGQVPARLCPTGHAVVAAGQRAREFRPGGPHAVLQGLAAAAD